MTIEEANTFLNNLKVCIEEHPIVADWLVEIADRKTENSSEKPNNCEHITEDGVTCARYPACDDCPDDPLNKVKGSERLVKGSEQTDCLDRYDRKTEPTISKMEQVETMSCRECKHYNGNDGCDVMTSDKAKCNYEPIEDEPQTDMAEDIVRSYGFKAESYRQAKAKTENGSEKPNNSKVSEIPIGSERSSE